jgi:hypothetical protein
MEADTDIPGGRVGFGTSAVYRADLSAAADRDIRLIWRACVEADVTARWTLIAAADGRVTLSGGEDLVSHRYTQLSAGAKWQALRHLQLEALAAVMGEGKNAGAGHGFSAGLRTDF